jgi:hypothetical protein
MKTRLAPRQVGQIIGRSARWVNDRADAGVITCERDLHGRRLYSPEVIPILEKALGLRSEEEEIQRTNP